MRRALASGERAGARYALATPKQTPTGLTGMQLGSRAGESLEFKDHRHYQPGDDLRRIDWQAYARSDKLIVKVYREEVNPHLDLLLDGSASMGLVESAKPRAALGLAAALVTAAENAGFAHQVHLAGEGCRPLEQGAVRPSAWPDVDFDATRSLAEALEQLPPRWRAQGLRVLVSDLLFMGDPLRTVEHLAHGAAGVHVVQLLADADVNPAQRGNVRLVDSESGAVREVFIDAAAERRYRDNLARHQQHWHAAVRQVGGTMTTLIAEPLVERWDLSDLVQAGVLEVG